MNVTLNGRLLTCDYESIFKKKERSIEPRPEWNLDFILEKYRNTVLMQAYSMKKKPNVFITLSYFNRSKHCWESLHKAITKYVSKLKAVYPRCWFFYHCNRVSETEWHVHLMGRTGTKKNEIRTEVKKWWGEIISSDDPDLFKVKFLKNDQKILRYLVHTFGSKKIRHYLKKLLPIIPTFPLHVINRKNIPPSKFTKYNFPIDTYIQIKETLGIKENNSNKETNILYSGSGFYILRYPKKMDRYLEKLSKGISKNAN